MDLDLDLFDSLDLDSVDLLLGLLDLDSLDLDFLAGLGLVELITGK